MKVSFQTKQESKQQQLEDFLKLSGAERFYRFLDLMKYFNKLPTNNKIKNNNGNFLIEIKKENPLNYCR